MKYHIGDLSSESSLFSTIPIFGFLGCKDNLSILSCIYMYMNNYFIEVEALFALFVCSGGTASRFIYL